MSKIYELIIFTASTNSYARAIREHLDPKNNIFSYLLTRDNCILTKNKIFIKDLRVI